MSEGPGNRNSFAKKSKKMKIPLQTDNVDYGKKTKMVVRSVDVVSSGTGKYYGSKTIMTKENKQSFTEYLITEDDDITTLPEKVIDELRGLIRKGASDLQQNWKDALELVNKAYHVANVRRPIPNQKGAWKQYEDLIAYGVRQLHDTRGRAGNWRKTDPVQFSETATSKTLEDRPMGKRRFFVEIPGERAVEADADSMDDIIDAMTNKLRREGAKIRVDHRTPEGAILSVWVNDVKRDKITVKEIS